MIGWVSVYPSTWFLILNRRALGFVHRCSTGTYTTTIRMQPGCLSTKSLDEAKMFVEQRLIELDQLT